VSLEGAASQTEAHIELSEAVTAHNYHPLPVVVAEGEGAWVTDVDGKRYLDCLAAYSALNFGHRHPELMAVMRKQMDRITLTSRAFHNDQLGPFCRDLARLAGMEAVLPMNTGVEAVETAIKVARRWGHTVRGIEDGQAEIIVAADNFHGRSTTVVGFSTDPVARTGFAPFAPGFTIVPYGDAEAVADAITPNTVAVMVEPIQGEAGVIIPPHGYLTELRRICTEQHVLFVVDEVQSGLGRTGTTFACEHEGVVPDVYILGKALGGGILPVSAVVSTHDVLGVITPGSHGSTFGGNPLAAAVGHAVVGLLESGTYQERARRLGARLEERLQQLVGEGVKAVRTRGLWAGVDIDPGLMTGRQMCERLAELGVLVKDTHGSTIRLSPPLIIEESELDWMCDRLQEALQHA
jgi:ornithine--oxo-acid transaminase